MNLKSKLTSLAVAAGMVGAIASTPASATLTLQFLDGGNNLLDFTVLPGPVANYDANGNQIPNYVNINLNGWRVQTILASTNNSADPNLFDYGMTLTFQAWRTNTTDSVKCVNISFNDCAGGKISQANSLNGVLKVRFSDDLFPTPPSPLQITGNLSVSNTPPLPYNASLLATAPLAFNYSTYTGLTGSPSGNPNANRVNSVFFAPTSSPFITMEAGVDFVSSNTTLLDPVNVIEDPAFPSAFLANAPGFTNAQQRLFTGSYTVSAIPVPEPAGLALFGAALFAVGAIRRRKSK